MTAGSRPRLRRKRWLGQPHQHDQPHERPTQQREVIHGGEHVRLAGEDMVELGIRRRSEEHTSELQSLMRISYAVFCLKKKKTTNTTTKSITHQKREI